jgi:hypothetical protein
LIRLHSAFSFKSLVGLGYQQTSNLFAVMALHDLFNGTTANERVVTASLNAFKSMSPDFYNNQA